jgi:DNA mismatch repair protein MutL
MTKIILLEEQIYNKIAAGEVIERPASIVKELVENSIDAGSTKIEIEVTDGGIASIRVQDNGEGIGWEDVDRAFLRHATSKLRSERDLQHLTTLGFRGEALASIAAVSKVKLRTADNENGIGVAAQISAGKIELKERIAFVRGTEITIEQLFYNVPARLKYFQSISSELGHVINYVNRLSLAHPEIAFTLISSGRTLYQTAGDGNLLHVIAAIYGNSTAAKMQEIRIENVDFTISGYTSKIEITRASRNYLTLLINGRYIKNFLLQNAIIRGYGDLLMGNRYPLTVLNIEMDPVIVDINVHPAKLEAKFSKEKELLELVEQGVRKALLVEGQIPMPHSSTFSYQSEDCATEEQLQVELETEILPNEIYEQKATLEPDLNIEKAQLPYLEPVAQLFGAYIIAQNTDGLFLIDQHAAHERINYEKNLAKIVANQLEPTDLLLPITLDYPIDAIAKLSAANLELEKLGLELEEFGEQTIIIRTVPNWVPKGEEQLYIENVLEALIADERIDMIELNRELVASASCKESLKANQFLSQNELLSLINQLRNTTNPYTCPHGRPITVMISKYELEKMFKRVL